MPESFYREEPKQLTFNKFLLQGVDIVETDDDSLALMKKTDTTYFIKSSISNGEFYNPWGSLNSKNELQSTKAGVSRYSWHKVNESAYNFYMRFLQTRNAAYLSNARSAI